MASSRRALSGHSKLYIISCIDPQHAQRSQSAEYCMPSIGPKRFLLDVDDDNEVSISIIHDT